MVWGDWAGYQTSNGQWVSFDVVCGIATSFALFSNTTSPNAAHGMLARGSGASAGSLSCMVTVNPIHNALARDFYPGFLFCMNASNPFSATAGYFAGFHRVNTAAPNMVYTILKLSGGISGTRTVLASSDFQSIGTASIFAQWMVDPVRFSGTQIDLYANNVLIFTVRDASIPVVSAVAQGLGVIGDSVTNMAISAAFDNITFATLSAS